MMLNKPMVDYLTLTGFSVVHDLAKAFFEMSGHNPKVAKQMQYKGHATDGLFFGTARQSDKVHAMLRASGEVAMAALWKTADADANCTRIDVQVTVEKPDDYDVRKLYDALNDAPRWYWVGKVPNLSFIQSGDGCDTLYIGSRTSRRFLRIYVKPDKNGEPRYIRLELESKGARANAVRDAIRKDPDAIARVLADELQRLPDLSDSALMAFMDAIGPNAQGITEKRVESENATLDWLETQVEPAVFRLLHSHEHSDRMRTILERWLDNRPA